MGNFYQVSLDKYRIIYLFDDTISPCPDVKIADQKIYR